MSSASSRLHVQLPPSIHPQLLVHVHVLVHVIRTLRSHVHVVLLQGLDLIFLLPLHFSFPLTRLAASSAPTRPRRCFSPRADLRLGPLDSWVLHCRRPVRILFSRRATTPTWNLERCGRPCLLGQNSNNALRTQPSALRQPTFRLALRLPSLLCQLSLGCLSHPSDSRHQEKHRSPSLDSLQPLNSASHHDTSHALPTQPLTYRHLPIRAAG